MELFEKTWCKLISPEIQDKERPFCVKPDWRKKIKGKKNRESIPKHGSGFTATANSIFNPWI